MIEGRKYGDQVDTYISFNNYDIYPSCNLACPKLLGTFDMGDPFFKNFTYLIQYLYLQKAGMGEICGMS